MPQIQLKKKGTELRIITRSNMADFFANTQMKSAGSLNGGIVEMGKTKTGYVNVSGLELTAADLFTYPQKAGGLNSAATVLGELSHKLNFLKLDNSFFRKVPATAIQRLGFAIDEILGQPKLANDLFNKAIYSNVRFQKISLAPGKKNYANTPINKKWKIIVNTTIEPDL